MEPTLELLFEEHASPTPERRLLMLRAALAAIPVSRTLTPDELREAAWALEGLCDGTTHALDSLETEARDDSVKSAASTIRSSLRQIRQELTGQLWELPDCLLRARSILLRALVLLTEVQSAVSRRRGSAEQGYDPIDVARAVMMLAVRGNPTDNRWIVLVAYAEIALLALVPREKIDAPFARRLAGLRTLLAECTNYESRSLEGLPSLGKA